MSQEVVSDLVANVIGISVSVGDQVEAGDEVAVLAEAPGRVTAVKVVVGDVVQEGDVLAVID